MIVYISVYKIFFGSSEVMANSPSFVQIHVQTTCVGNSVLCIVRGQAAHLLKLLFYSAVITYNLCINATCAVCEAQSGFWVHLLLTPEFSGMLGWIARVNCMWH